MTRTVERSVYAQMPVIIASSPNAAVRRMTPRLAWGRRAVTLLEWVDFFCARDQAPFDGVPELLRDTPSEVAP